MFKMRLCLQKKGAIEKTGEVSDLSWGENTGAVLHYQRSVIITFLPFHEYINPQLFRIVVIEARIIAPKIFLFRGAYPSGEVNAAAETKKTCRSCRAFSATCIR